MRLLWRETLKRRITFSIQFQSLLSTPIKSNMEILQIIHHCLFFRLNKQKYLFGLTHSLYLDSNRLTKITIDHIVLPSLPYLPALSTNFWHLQALAFSNTHSIIVSDEHTKKRIEQILTQTGISDSHKYSWSLFTHFQIEEDNLVKALLSIHPSPPLAHIPFGVGYNTSLGNLNLVVTDKAHSILLIHGCDVIVLDPCEKIQELLSYYGIPLAALKGVLLTNSRNLNWFECLMKMRWLQLITERKTYAEVINRIKSYFLWSEDMVKKRLKAKVLCQADKWHKLGPLQISFHLSHEGRLASLQISFGLKKIQISLSLDSFPSQIIQESQLQYLIAYDIENQTKKYLQSIPEAYRKKIIFNRVSHKYNNKYFATINLKELLLTIEAHSHQKAALLAPRLGLACQYREKDRNAQFKVASIQHKQRWNADGRVVYICQGYAREDSGKIYEPGSCIVGHPSLIGQGRALVMYHPQSYLYFYHRREQCEKTLINISESLIYKLKDNSFISGLRKTTMYQGNCLGQNCLEEQHYENGSQWELFNLLCQMKTFQVGSDEVDCQNCIYFVLKGSMKFSQSEMVASKNMMIGNFKKYYSNFYHSEDKIQVLKDTWALEVPIKALHQHFCTKFPQKMYELFTKPSVFA